MDQNLDTLHFSPPGIEDKDDAEDAAFPKYTYKPLPLNETIRVIDLCNTTLRLECKITQMPISQCEYVALSYVWGNAETPYRIIVLDEAGIPKGYISLTSNLHNALQDLRGATNVSSKRFWIDQITINQADDREKGYQVGLMGKIYRHASQVITYLGPHSANIDDEQEALRLLTRLDAHFRPNYKYFSADSLWDYSHNIANLPVHTLPDTISVADPVWPALLRIVCGDWTQRLWMVQENILCRDTVMLRGRQILDWLSVASVHLLFYLGIIPDKIISQSWPTLGIESDPSGHIDQLMLTWERRFDWSEGVQTARSIPTLVENLDFYDALRCRDQRDMIFALLSISSDTEQLGIKPDYESSVAEGLLRVSMQIYLGTKSVELLRIVGDRGQNLDLALPSWVFAGQQVVVHQTDPLFSNPKLAANIQFAEGNRLMVIKGRVIGHVRLVTPPIDYIRSIWTDEVYSRLYGQVTLAIIDTLRGAQFSFESLSDFAAAWIADASRMVETDKIESAFRTWALYRYVVTGWFQRSGGAITKDATVSELLHTTLHMLLKVFADTGKNMTHSAWDSGTEEELHLGEEMWTEGRFQGRSIGIMENGKICSLNGRAQRGDTVAFLDSGTDAFLLRPIGDQFCYIGTIYSPDFVVYKAKHVEEDKDFLDQEIKIC